MTGRRVRSWEGLMYADRAVAEYVLSEAPFIVRDPESRASAILMPSK